MNCNTTQRTNRHLDCTLRPIDRIHDLAPYQAQLLRSAAIDRFWSSTYASLRQTLRTYTGA